MCLGQIESCEQQIALANKKRAAASTAAAAALFTLQ
jgi:hypothetical protein